MIRFRINKVVQFVWSKGWAYASGWTAMLGIIPRVDLTDQGELILCGLRIHATFVSFPEGLPRFWIECRSDAKMIADRIVARA